jgi:hypothetical protein
MYFIFGNFGDNTVALIRWAYLQKLKEVTILYIETGWSSVSWQRRVQESQVLLARYGFQSRALKPKRTFIELIRERGEPPSAKFQWCSTFLKALPLLSFLDEVDPSCEGVILLGSSQSDSRARHGLSEFIEESEHYGGRTIWYPLFDKTLSEKQDLIAQTGLCLLGNRSQECLLCIHSAISEIKSLDQKILKDIASLEDEIGTTFFHSRYPEKSIKQLHLEQSCEEEQLSLERFDAGCGSRYVCGE